VTPAAGLARSRRGGGLHLPYGWPLYAMFFGFPVWWALGLSGFIWPLLAAPMLVSLLQRRDVRAPRGFGVWIAFLIWMAASGTKLEGSDRVLAFAYRGSLYASATVMFLYVFNSPKSLLPTRKVLLALAGFALVVIGGGFLGVFLPKGQFKSLAEVLLPGGIANQSFLHALIHPAFAQNHKILGYTVGRPQAPFAYTNVWGGNMALLAPLLFLALGQFRSRVWRAVAAMMMVLSIVPIVLSLDRGLWVSLIAGFAYLAVRFALEGHMRTLVSVLTVVLIAGALVYLGPLRKVVDDRLAHPHSDKGREALYQQATEKTLDSPLLGYGAPLANETPDKPSIGTHGQFWLVLVSQGIPGMLLFVAWMFFLIGKTSRGAPTVGLWCHAVVFIGLVQLPFYELFPSQLLIVMVAASLHFRELIPEARAWKPVPVRPSRPRVRTVV
jgi:polysaccharide biosynthesis protein PslJ